MPAKSQNIRDELETLYRHILQTRMDGLPVLNKALSVTAIGFEPFLDYHLGVLSTPWFMNLMLVPQEARSFTDTKPVVGETQPIALPAGNVDFIVGYEEVFGYSLSCSLFSPVFEFSDQEAALQTADAALQEVLSPPNNSSEVTDEDADMRDIWAGRLPEPETAGETTKPESKRAKSVSRRQLFFGPGGKTCDRTRIDLTTEEQP